MNLFKNILLYNNYLIKDVKFGKLSNVLHNMNLIYSISKGNIEYIFKYVKEGRFKYMLSVYDFPTVVNEYTKYWYFYGNLHRANGPAIIHDENGKIFIGENQWYQYGKLKLIG